MVFMFDGIDIMFLVFVLFVVVVIVILGVAVIKFFGDTSITGSKCITCCLYVVYASCCWF